MGAMEKKRLLCVLALSCWLLALSPKSINLAAQDIKTEPTQEELNRAKQIIHDFQKPREKEARDIIHKFQGPNEEKAKEFFQIEETGKQNKNSQRQLFYFFSFSMPEGSIKAIIPEAEKTGAVIVIRGMKEDIGLRTTLMKVAEVLKHSSILRQGSGLTTGSEKESYKAEVWIHPLLFRCFHVDAVPQIVYVVGKQDAEGCSSDYIKVRGDVSLEYALSLIAKEDKSAEKYLKLLKEDFYNERKN
jgi:type-F conjugative transfer system pilin assembly protein TrbC